MMPCLMNVLTTRPGEELGVNLSECEGKLQGKGEDMWQSCGENKDRSGEVVSGRSVRGRGIDRELICLSQCVKEGEGALHSYLP